MPGENLVMAARKIKLSHPGKILREEFMEPVGLSAYALAKALSVPLPGVNDIVREKRSISPEMAVLLSAYFGTSDAYWINLQGRFNLEAAKTRSASRLPQSAHTRTARTAACSLSDAHAGLSSAGTTARSAGRGRTTTRRPDDDARPGRPDGALVQRHCAWRFVQL